jgi:hypothetical protein
VASTLDSDSQLALLTAVETSLYRRFNLSVEVYKTLQSFDVTVVKVCRNVFLKSSGHYILLENKLCIEYTVCVHFGGKTAALTEDV